jgi:hypothetical protein
MKDDQLLQIDISLGEVIHSLIKLSFSGFRAILIKFWVIFKLIRVRSSLRKMFRISYRTVLLNRWRHHRDEKHKAKASA